MAKVFTECGAEEYALLAALIRRYRDDLTEAEARVTLLFVADENGGPALLHHGQKVAGMAKVNSYRDKVEGKADATITLDEESWRGRTERQQQALLHHELSHLGWERGKYDPLGRPKLHAVDGDWENDGFYEVCRIYGEDAPERRYLEGVRERLRQIGLPLAGGEAEDVPLGRPTAAQEAPPAAPPAPAPGADPDAATWLSGLERFPSAALAPLGITGIQTVADLRAFLFDGGVLAELEGMDAKLAVKVVAALERHDDSRGFDSGTV